MITIIDLAIDNVVAFSCEGKVSKADMEQILSLAKEKIAQYGDIVLYYEFLSFSGVEMAAIAEEFKFIKEIGLSHIKKVAVITDKKWVEVIVKLENTIFRSIDMKSFSTDEKSAAIDFIKISQ